MSPTNRQAFHFSSHSSPLTTIHHRKHLTPDYPNFEGHIRTYKMCKDIVYKDYCIACNRLKYDNRKETKVCSRFYSGGQKCPQKYCKTEVQATHVMVCTDCHCLLRSH
jgi:hypothetical protein